MNQLIPILVYHHVYPDDHPELEETWQGQATGVISESEFIRHIKYISAEGWVTVSTNMIVDWIEDKHPLPEKAVALHFDNGWPDALTVVAPILSKYGMAGTCYVITSPTSAASDGRPAMINTTTEGLVEKKFLTWNGARKLLQLDWEIGAHTHTHPKLAELRVREGEDALIAEIDASDDMFREHLGFIPTHFAYPSGSRDEHTDSILSSRYRSLRRWTFNQPPVWRFTGYTTSPFELECQNVDNTVSFGDFRRIFEDSSKT